MPALTIQLLPEFKIRKNTVNLSTKYLFWYFLEPLKITSFQDTIGKKYFLKKLRKIY